MVVGENTKKGTNHNLNQPLFELFWQQYLLKQCDLAGSVDAFSNKLILCDSKSCFLNAKQGMTADSLGCPPEGVVEKSIFSIVNFLPFPIYPLEILVFWHQPYIGNYLNFWFNIKLLNCSSHTCHFFSDPRGTLSP